MSKKFIDLSEYINSRRIGTTFTIQNYLWENNINLARLIARYNLEHLYKKACIIDDEIKSVLVIPKNINNLHKLCQKNMITKGQIEKELENLFCIKTSDDKLYSVYTYEQIPINLDQCKLLKQFNNNSLPDIYEINNMSELL